MARAFITGITGQGGSYLCEQLLEKGYEVHDLVHRPDALSVSNLRQLIADENILTETGVLFAENSGMICRIGTLRTVNLPIPSPKPRVKIRQCALVARGP